MDIELIDVIKIEKQTDRIRNKESVIRIFFHYSDVIMGPVTFQITSLTIVCSTVYSGADQRKFQSSASVAFVRGIHQWPVNSPHKWPVTRKMFPFDDVIMFGNALEHWVRPLAASAVFGKWVVDHFSTKAWKYEELLISYVCYIGK